MDHPVTTPHIVTQQHMKNRTILKKGEENSGQKIIVKNIS